jgi:hypothetical protein
LIVYLSAGLIRTECAKFSVKLTVPIEVLQRIASRIEIGRRQIRLVISSTGLQTWLLPEMAIDESEHGTDAEDPVVTIPVKLRRCGIETRLVLPGKDDTPPPMPTVHALQDAMAKALAWNASLVTGKVTSMKALAEHEGVTQRHIAHLIQLAWLAPDFVRAIQTGKVPADVTLDRLKAGFPLVWAEQRDVLGFSTYP